MKIQVKVEERLLKQWVLHMLRNHEALNSQLAQPNEFEELALMPLNEIEVIIPELKVKVLAT